MNREPRQRYYARRREVERRRRTMFFFVSGAVVILLLFGISVQRLVAPPRPGEVADVDITPTPPSTTPEEPAESDELAPGGDDQQTDETLIDNAEEPVGIPTAEFFHPQRLVYEPNYYVPEIQTFLDEQPGRLKNTRLSVRNRQHTFAEIIVGQTSYYGVNPKVILTLLEVQSGLLSTEETSSDQINWAMGYKGNEGRHAGLRAQVRWAVGQIYTGKRDYPDFRPLRFANPADEAEATDDDDDTDTAVQATPTATPEPIELDPPPDMDFSEYLIARVLAPTTTPEQLDAQLQLFLETYTELFGDPRIAPDDWPAPAEPFLIRPTEYTARVTSFFDHDAPLLGRNGSISTYWGRDEEFIYYDGHDGWDYALAPPDVALAAADGEVVFSGNADDNCETGAIVVDHQNGYRTLYWHMDSVSVSVGDQVEQGQAIGVIGNTGCSFGPHLHLGVHYLGVPTSPYGWCNENVADPWPEHLFGTESRWLWMDRPSPCGPPPTNAVVVDTESEGFSTNGDTWQPSPLGYGGDAMFISSVRGVSQNRPWTLRPLTEPVVAVYRPDLPSAGRYRVLAYVPYFYNGLDDAKQVRYRVQYSGGEAEVIADIEVYANDWIDLGTYDFVPEDAPLVSLSNIVEAQERSVWADAVMWIPVNE